MRSRNETQAIGCQCVSRQHAEQQDALKRAGEIKRQFQCDLGGLPAINRECDGEGAKYDAYRMQAPEIGHDDRRKTKPAGDCGLELPNLTRDFNDPR